MTLIYFQIPGVINTGGWAAIILFDNKYYYQIDRLVMGFSFGINID